MGRYARRLSLERFGHICSGKVQCGGREAQCQIEDSEPDLLVSDTCRSLEKIQLSSGLCCLAISTSSNRLLTRIAVMLLGSEKLAGGERL